MIRSVVRVELGVGIDPTIWTEVDNLVEVVLTGGRADRKARFNGGSRLVICKLLDAERRPPFSCVASSLLESPGVPRTARAKQRKERLLTIRQQCSFPISVHASLVFFLGRVKQTDATGIYLEDGSYQLLASFTRRLPSFGSFHQLLHRPSDIGFDCLGQLILAGEGTII